MICTLKIGLIVGVVVLAVAGITVGIVFATMGDDCVDFDAPSNLKFEEADAKLFLKWGAPDNLGDCTAKYRIRLTIDGEVQESFEHNGLQYELDELEYAPCTKISATIATIDENGDESDETTAEYTIAIGDVSKVGVDELEANPSNDDFIVTWKAPSTFSKCAIKYQVVLNGQSLSESHSEESINIEKDDLNPCSNTVAVKPIIETEEGKSETTNIDIALGDVSEIIVEALDKESSSDGWTIKWNKPSGFDTCDVVYEVTVNNNIIQGSHTGETILISNNDLNECADNTVKVVPVIERKKGKEQEIIIELDVTGVSVTGLDKEQSSDGWTIKWNKPSGFDACNIAYEVSVNDNVLQESHTSETITISNDDLNVCTDNTVKVIPVIEGKKAEKQTITIELDVAGVIVTGLDKEPSADGWTIKWNKPSGFDNCNFVHEISINDVIVQESHAGETISVLNSDLNGCSDNTVKVIPIIEGKKGGENTITITMDVAGVTVTGLEKEPSSDGWTIKWNRPSGFDTCDVVYEVTVNSNIVQGSHNVETIQISNNDLNECADNTVKVIPVIAGKKGKEQEIIIELDVAGVSVTGLDKEQSSDGWTIKWNKPSGFDACNIAYEVSVNDNVLQESHTSETITISNDDLNVCTDNTVKVIPIIEGKKAEEQTIPIELDVAGVIVTGLDKEPSADGWTIKWNKPSGFDNCNFVYEININDVIVQESHAGETISVLNSDLNGCSDNTVKVIPIIEGKKGGENTITITMDVAGVTVTELEKEPSSDGWTITWNRPSGFDTCDVVYEVAVNSNIVQGSHNVETIQISNNDLNECADNTVKVIPVIAGKKGKEQEIIIELDVTGVTVTGLDKERSSDGWTIKWNKPSGFDACNIAYEVSVNDNVLQESHTSETITISNDDLNVCTDNTVKVIPVIEGKKAEKQTITIELDVAGVTVTGLEKEPSVDGWTIKWNKPNGFDNCNFVYEISINDVIVQESHAGETISLLNSDLNGCSDNTVKVIPIIEGKKGEEQTIDITMDVAGVTVTGLEKEASSDGWTIKWNRPSGFDTCDVVYEVTVNSNIIQESHAEETIPISNNDLNECADNTVKVVPVIEEKKGKGQEIIIELDVTGVSVTGLDKEQSSDGWTIKWNKPSGFDACNIAYEVSVNDNVLQESHTSETITISNDDLNVCTDNIVKVIPIIEGKKAEQQTITIELDVAGVTVTGLDKEPSADGWTIKWNKPSGFDACNIAYEVSVNDNVLQESQTSETITISNDDLNLCTDNTVKIIPVIEGKKADQQTITIELDVAGVIVTGLDKELSSDGWTIKWNKPSGFDACNIAYEVSVNDNVLQESHTSETITISNDDLNVCTDNIVKVIPIIEGKKAEQQTITIELDVTGVTVTGLEKEPSADGWTIKWNKPSGFDNCNFVYEISINDVIVQESHAGETISVLNSDLNGCSDNTVKVIPIIEGKKGEKQTIDITMDVAEVTVTGLEKEASSDGWTIKWNRPSGFDTCDVVYEVTVNSNIIQESHTGETIPISNNDLNECADNTVKVVPVIEGKKGKEQEIIIELDVTGVTVTGLEKESSSDGWTIKWNRPSGFDACNIAYEVSVNDIVLQASHTGETITISNDDLNVCTDNTVKVIPIIEGKKAEERTIPIELDVTNVDVGELLTQEDEDGWTISWSKPVGYEACTTVYEVLLDGEQKQDSYDKLSIQFLNGDTKICVNNQVTVRPIIESKPAASKDTTIVGNPVSVGEVQNGKIEVLAESTVKVTWDKPQGLEQCELTYKVQLSKEGVELGDVQTANTNEFSTVIDGIEDCDLLSASVTAIYKVKEGSPTAINCTPNQE